jgi:hypothetical protein
MVAVSGMPSSCPTSLHLVPVDHQDLFQNGTVERACLE